MNQNIEYQIIIGCNDHHTKGEYVSDEELSKTIVDFFTRKEIDFSLLKLTGGYLYKGSGFVFENSVCITIVGSDDRKIVRLAKAFKMYMNQETVLITKNKLQNEMI